MRPSSTCSIRLLNEELKPRAFTACEMTPVCTNSSPFTSLSALANELPMVLAICASSSRVIVAGASVIFSTRRDAEVTMPPSWMFADSSWKVTFASWPSLTAMLLTVFWRNPKR